MSCSGKLVFHLILPSPKKTPADIHRDHVGVHAQKQAGLVYLGASVLRGRITPQQLRAAADLADRYADGHIRTTTCRIC